METNLPGVYAAGDVALQEDQDPLNLIVVGYGQVTVAVNYAYTAIKPGGEVFPGHSSEKLAAKSWQRKNRSFNACCTQTPR
jgi:hypothetical protein